MTLRVSAVRSQNPYGRGGAIFTGVEVDDRGWRVDAKTHYVVKASSQLLLAPVEAGQLWRVTGPSKPNTIVINGYRLTESTITPDAMEMLRPSGEHIITLLAQGDAFEGIGEVKARRLWEHFGDTLFAVLDQSDVDQLEAVMPRAMAQRLAEAWLQWGNTFTLQWLQSKGFAVSLGRKILDFYGKDAAKRIEDDPYRLLSFAANWAVVDTLAQNTFGLVATDPRRLAGAVEEALYASFDAGHTCIPEAELLQRLRSLLQSSDLAKSAVLQAESLVRFIRQGDRLHAPGPYVMERGVAQAIAIRASKALPLLDERSLAAHIADYQGQGGISLHHKQIEALALANAHPFCVITGGAGTGKTTVLRGMFQLYERAGYTVYPMALSGRAAKRIGEATGHSAQTIAGFLKHFDANAARNAVVVIDEASMVDLPSAYRVLRQLPEHYRVVLVGDPNQLPPVGPGLLLHELAHHPRLPVVELTQIKRYGGAIAEAAALIRSGEWPSLADDANADIAFVPCALDQINEIVLGLYDQDRSGSQILCATRSAAFGGMNAINALCQKRINDHGEPLMIWNLEFDQPQGTGLRVGDPVICLRNDWEIDLQNGSLGVLLSAEIAAPDKAPGSRIGSVLWDDGRTRDLTIDLLAHLELAYAITIHKAQGSGFGRVIIPVRHSKLLDRTLLYTAVTRAEQQVILVGDVHAAKAAVLAPRHSERRHVALGAMLDAELSEGLATMKGED
ncbi:ATP-dependent RecD-like DNA helicase [Rhodoferax sp. U2-2l]|uniref:ATP-dependent DNA helicase n=1 Tax=Rhodoferax sp. U2-2l TaxID=2884000 RepID=UPI001D0B6A22|nr:AAA family ATPase [Rhodoferax sp. U2-2l]MCB8747008.1 ATP-dependent RecD-like DNA helicase [Rhodoferax sp. U2-2l]